MTSFDPKAGDNIYWMRHVLRTDLRYQTEIGNAFTASDRWTIAGQTTEYLEFRVPVGKIVRIYDRITAQTANTFHVDLCSVTSITAGNTEFAHTNMRVGMGSPVAKIWRGATNPVGLVVREYNLLPAAHSGNSSGGLSDAVAYRTILGSETPSILRVRNNESGDADFNIIVLYAEQDE